ncbi:P-loop containing nucleoside triphosphate hydrolase protein [Hypoxylon crocopeplum]|nr:P-loop containing nucleoside triphosphate hydrolase protein [Hypoxylon crocopeplum]
MTRIDDEFSMVDSTEAHGDSAVSQTPEPSRHQQSKRQGPPKTNSGDDADAEELSDLVLDNTYVSAFSPQAEDSSRTSYLGDFKSLYKEFTSPYKWNSPDILVAVMGMTGSGKTTFISKVTGRTDLKIGHGLTSCTQEIQVVETTLDGHTVRLVDTPGFSDTYLSDTEVLEMIADYLAVAYSKNMRLSGIIYLHPISDNRVTHHATKNLQMFRKLTGEKNLKNVILATSMWDKVTQEERAKREHELQNKFWNVLIAFGAKYSRYDGSVDSAKQITSTLVSNKPFYLQLQEEMGKGNKALKDTAAGKEIMVELSRMKEQHQAELAEIKETQEMLLRTSAEENKAAVAALEEHYKGMLQGMKKTLADERRMNEAAINSMAERIKALENRGPCAVM